MKITEKQKQILELISQGKTNMEIAEEMHYSEANVKKNLQKLFKMFKVRNRAALGTTYLSIKFADWV